MIQGDCLKILPTLVDESVDLVVTSPPYNLKINYGVCKDDMSWEEYYDWCRKWLSELYRILKPDGRLCLNHYLSCGTADNRSAPLLGLYHICLELGFKHHGVAIWNDITLSKLTAWGSWLSASSPYINSPFEGILIMYKERWKKDRRGESTISKEEFIKAVSGVWNLGTDHLRLTPSTFPESLPRYCINLLSYLGDVVLDPFLGSGTTMKVAQDLGRSCIGIEINPEYCRIIKKRCFGRTFLNREVEYKFEVEL
ncbi:MAG: DNA-methyltransferase [Candidatus Helarchaeota archaeon]